MVKRIPDYRRIKPKKHYIYVLRDPDTEEIKYVGLTENFGTRFDNHCTEGRRGARSKKNIWIKGLLDQGKKPIMDVVEEVKVGNPRVREAFWVKYLQTEGHELLNGVNSINFDRWFKKG